MEFTICGVYYRFLMRCSPKEVEADVAKQLDYINNAQYDIGHTIGMTEEAMVSRYKMVIDDQMNLMHQSCDNFSSLTELE